MSQLTLMSPVAAKKLGSVWNLKPRTSTIQLSYYCQFWALFRVFFFKNKNLVFFRKLLWFLNFGDLFLKNLEFFFEFIHSKKKKFQFFWSLQCKKNLSKKIKAGCNYIRARVFGTNRLPAHREGWMDGWMVGGQENTFPLGSSCIANHGG